MVTYDQMDREGLQEPSWPRWGSMAAVALAIVTALIVTLAVAQSPVKQASTLIGGPFWQAPVIARAGVTLLAVLALFARSRIAQVAAVVAFGLATMGTIAYVEPMGVFHDSWQNVGLGQLVLSASNAEVARQVSYVASTPGSFVLFGLLADVFPDTPGFLRAFPVLCLLFYGSGIYTLATAFADAHQGQLRIDRARFGLMAVFAFLGLAPLFWIRVNPAPQSLAFGLMPFCLAAVLNSSTSTRFRVLALATFGVIIAIHPITAVMTLAIIGMWLLIDWLLNRRAAISPILASNTVVLYGCLFLSWLIYIGVWIIRSGGSFVRRMFDVLDSGQHATVSAAASEKLLAFIWLHRVALAGGALLVAAGVGLLILKHRAASLRLIVWFLVAAAWLPMMLFGEFADRGPLFASLPAALAVGFALSAIDRRNLRRLVGLLTLTVVVTSYITAYSNHIGEIITDSETAAFNVIAEQSGGRRIAYGYVPPLTGKHLLLYDGQHIRAYALGAADFSFNRFTATGDIIVISGQMREAAALRGPRALAALEQFENNLLADQHYQLIFDNGSVRAFRAR